MWFFLKKTVKNKKEAEWKFNKRDLCKKRKIGISGFMRIRNEEDYLALAIESYLPFLDELIIVHNRCTDRSPEIANFYEKKYPNKIKVYEYKPYVYPQGSKEHAKLPPSSIYSLVNYYNFALSKVTYKYAIKVDGDQVAIPKVFEKAVEKVLTDNSTNKYYTCKGINLWDSNNKIYVNLNRPYTGGADQGFFPVSKRTYFKHHEIYEVLSHNLKMENLGVLFFHLKGMKKDRGISNYDLHDNPDSFYHQLVKNCYTKPRLISFEEFFKKENLGDDFCSPEDLGIKPIVKRV